MLKEAMPWMRWAVMREEENGLVEIQKGVRDVNVKRKRMRINAGKS